MSGHIIFIITKTLVYFSSSIWVHRYTVSHMMLVDLKCIHIEFVIHSASHVSVGMDRSAPKCTPWFDNVIDSFVSLFFLLVLQNYYCWVISVWQL